ncbi:hypothetical protein AgCh_019220 [Apium graveolens]
MSCSTVEIEHFSHPKHPLVLKEDDVIGADAKCCLCNKPVIGSPTNEIEENGIVDDEPDLVQFPLPGKESLFDLIITQCSKLRVEFQGEGGNNANTSMIANDPHIIEKHWSHQEHPLELHQLTVSVNNNNDNDDNDDGGGDDRRVLICDGSDNPGTPLVTMLLTEQNYHQWSRSVSIALSAKLKLGFIDGSVSKPTDNNIQIAMWNRCNDMVVSWLSNSISTEIRNSVAYLSTAQQIWEDLATRFSQSNMPRTFQFRKDLSSLQQGNLSVTSYLTKFKTLVAEIDNLAPIPKCTCKVIHHEGHKEHSLTSQRQALFKCDACWEEDKDYSYVCYTCDFWIHEKCASSPPIIPAPTYHHHPLTLIFSIPVMHRYFGRLCAICNKRVQSLCWSYYCHKCTFFVHIQCSKSTISLGNEIEEEGIVDDEPELVQFPLPSEESLFDLIITQCSKLRVEFQGEGGNSANIPLIANDPHIIKKHWSHPDHPLELHQLTISVNDNNDDDDDDDVDRRVLICDGVPQEEIVPRTYVESVKLATRFSTFSNVMDVDILSASSVLEEKMASEEFEIFPH